MNKIILDRLGKNDIKFELLYIKDDIINDLSTYLPNLINYLFERPDVISLILKNADTKVLKEYLAPFLVNNFYENLITSHYIDDNLIYVLTLLLKDEINNLNTINQEEIFLDDTICGCLFEELRRKNDIQSFFKNIILEEVEKLEENNCNLDFDFNISNLNYELLKLNTRDSNENNKILINFPKRKGTIIKNGEKIFKENYICCLDNKE